MRIIGLVTAIALLFMVLPFETWGNIQRESERREARNRPREFPLCCPCGQGQGNNFNIFNPDMPKQRKKRKTACGCDCHGS